MRNISDFIALSEPDVVTEVVLYHAKVVTMILDVCRKIGAVAPPYDTLLAASRRTPVNFQLQLISLDQSWGLGESLPQLRQKKHEPMRTSPKIRQAAVGTNRRTPGYRTLNELYGLDPVPLLRAARGWNRERHEHEKRTSHHRCGISGLRKLTATGLALFVMGCTDLPFESETASTDDLAILMLQSTAPAPPTTEFTFVTSGTAVRQIVHPDQFNSPFLEFRFGPNSITGQGNVVFGSSDTVTVVVRPEPGTYGFTLSPNDLVFNPSIAPRVTFFFGQHGDFTPPNSPAVDPSALALWRETGLARWERVPNTTASGLDQLTGSLTTPGTYILASRR